VGKRYVVVCDIVEEVNFFLFQEKPCGNRVDRCISPSLIEKASILVKRLEEIEIRL
jgi:hypothetical protein